MINTNGMLAVMDHHITINWDDGPTMHRIAAQVRYRATESAMLRTMRVSASQRYSDDPLSFVTTCDGLRASWIWQERGPGWTAQLSVTNEGADDVYLDALDVIRIDYAFGGLFNLGAPPGLWRVLLESAQGLLAAPSGDEHRRAESDDPAAGWESWSPATLTATGFARRRCLIVQPVASNRTRPPAVMIRALEGDGPVSSVRTEIQLEVSGERFERLSARYRAEGMLLGTGGSVASPEFWVVSGDDAEELRGVMVDD
ncbi:MAG: hypothetical protein D6709_00975 [Chloroflexi bacterium]|jgi:hypothetical protein|uniref:Uncharacterized protein n=1 Tax=Candidatus Thermofonsia Clade 3 bacterium TaxID=2364212 RepID=A0A2M8QCZ6_9CHLR|nr:hypothetical protein [Candidatus Roseilinea sp. NK_OTU-006]PJF47679.1 MAG: hypothetical protein CUN48_07345 [Candidatus Thermofonsia Clade 3 bacterium]RMG65997.1 MAG: hypothetical protein D6709_00975 [Chloroflexota bacterium]